MGDYAVSVIVPVLNEVQSLKTHASFYTSLVVRNIELIFVDGGSVDGSWQYLSDTYPHVFQAKAGRARQMNLGAKRATGKHLLFLHADTVLPASFSDATLVDCDTWGFFKLRLSGGKWIYRLIERAIHFRSRCFQVATGDQVLFFQAAFFRSLGGFPNIDLMEDISLTRSAAKITQPQVLPLTVISSSRRWEKHGPLKTIVFMWYLQLLHKLGVNTRRLNRMYREGRWY